MDLIISNCTDLRSFLNDPRITLNQAVKISESFCSVIFLDHPENKTEFLILLDQFIDKYENFKNFEKPIFWNIDLDVKE